MSHSTPKMEIGGQLCLKVLSPRFHFLAHHALLPLYFHVVFHRILLEFSMHVKEKKKTIKAQIED